MSKEKAEAFAIQARSIGWDASVKTKGERTTVTATRGDEAVTIYWEAGKFIDDAYYARGDYRRKMRNASGALRAMGDAPRDAGALAPRRGRPRKEPEPVDTAGRKRPTIDGPPRRTKSAVSRELMEMSRDDILRRVAGKRIVWVNSLTGNHITYRVAPDLDQPHFTVAFSSAGSRIIGFCAADGYFAAVAIASIVDVR